jgi:hypothetical protein
MSLLVLHRRDYDHLLIPFNDQIDQRVLLVMSFKYAGPLEILHKLETGGVAMHVKV